MALVPFPVSSPAPAATPSSARVSGPVRGSHPGSAAAGPSTRASGPSVSAPPAEARRKPQPAFAQVLAAAQDDESGAARRGAVAAASRATAQVTDTPLHETEKTDEGDEALVTAPVAPVKESRIEPASSWLLIALAQGTMGRGGHDNGVVSAEDEAAAEAAVPTAIEPAGATTAAAVPMLPPADVATAPPASDGVSPGNAQVTTLGEAATVAPAPAQLQASPSAFGAGSAAQAQSGEVPDAAPDGATITDAAVPGVATAAAITAGPVQDAGGSQAAAAANVAEAPAVERAPAPPPMPDAVARWRAASRALAGAERQRLGVLAPEAIVAGSGEQSPRPVAPAVTLGAAPGAAARELARMLGATPQAVDAAGRHEWLAAAVVEATPVAIEPATAAVPSAADVLRRLVQAVEEPQRAAGGAVEQGGASVFGGMLGGPSNAPAAAVASAPAPIPTLPPAVGEQVNTHILSSLKMQWKDGIGEAKLHLRPDEFGSVTVALRVEHGAVTAVVRSDSAQVQDWVLQHQQTLRQQMESAGLRLDELTVSPDDRGQQEQDGSPAERRRRARPEADDADAPVFELLA